MQKKCSLIGRTMLKTLLLTCTLSATVLAEQPSQPIADCHCHLLDFLQNGDILLNGNLQSPQPGDALPVGKRHARMEMIIYSMDRANVSHALISGMPFIKRWNANSPWRPEYYLDSTSRLVVARDSDYVIANAVTDWMHEAPVRFAKQFNRLFPSICALEITDLNSVDRIVKLAREFPGVWKAVGEIFSRHDDASNLTMGERPRANHPGMKRIADFCGQVGLPVWMHHNLAPISRGHSDTGRRYVAELRDLYNTCPKTKFIHCHAGVSRRIIVDDLVAIHDELLSKYPNVTVDLSWVVFEQEIVLADRFDANGDPVINPNWIRIIEKHPKRFMLGSDKVGSFAGYRNEIRKWDALLNQLQPKTAKMVAQTNFLHLMPSKGLTLPDNYHYPEAKFVPLRDDRLSTE